MDHSVEVTGSGTERGPAGVLCYLASPCATASVILVKALWAFWGEPGSPLAITLFLECSPSKDNVRITVTPFPFPHVSQGQV